MLLEGDETTQARVCARRHLRLAIVLIVENLGVVVVVSEVVAVLVHISRVLVTAARVERGAVVSLCVCACVSLTCKESVLRTRARLC